MKAAKTARLSCRASRGKSALPESGGEGRSAHAAEEATDGRRARDGSRMDRSDERCAGGTGSQAGRAAVRFRDRSDRRADAEGWVQRGASRRRQRTSARGAGEFIWISPDASRSRLSWMSFFTRRRSPSAGNSWIACWPRRNTSCGCANSGTCSSWAAASETILRIGGRRTAGGRSSKTRFAEIGRGMRRCMIFSPPARTSRKTKGPRGFSTSAAMNTSGSRRRWRRWCTARGSIARSVTIIRWLEIKQGHYWGLVAASTEARTWRAATPWGIGGRRVHEFHQLEKGIAAGGDYPADGRTIRRRGRPAIRRSRMATTNMWTQPRNRGCRNFRVAKPSPRRRPPTIRFSLVRLLIECGRRSSVGALCIRPTR